MTAIVFTQAERARWSVALVSFQDDAPLLAEAFATRWRNNAIMSPPVGLPPVDAISEELGWSVALELFFLSFEEATAETDLLRDAIGAAQRSTGDESRGDAWLEDILALRRIPPPFQRRSERQVRKDIDLVALDLLLGGVEQISRDLPEPDEAAYNFFGRMYDALANAFVAEVVRPDDRSDIILGYCSGARIVSPYARNSFNALQELLNIAYWVGDDDQTDFATSEEMMKLDGLKDRRDCQISELVDSIALSNEGLEQLERRTHYWPKDECAALLALHRTAFARRFDDAFLLLLAADSIEHKTGCDARLSDLEASLRLVGNNETVPGIRLPSAAEVQTGLARGPQRSNTELTGWEEGTVRLSKEGEAIAQKAGVPETVE